MKTAIAAVLCLLAAPALHAADPVPSKIDRVVDGGAYKVYYRNRVVSARLIGVEMPGLKKMRNKTRIEGEYDRELRVAREARVFAVMKLPPGTDVYLEFDKEKMDRRKGFYLVYLWLDKDRKAMMNEMLLREGYGTVSDQPPPGKYKECFWKAQAEAKLIGKGLWEK